MSRAPCASELRQGRVKGRPQPAALLCRLAAKRGWEVGRKPAAAGPGGERGGGPEKKQKDLPTGATSRAPRSCIHRAAAGFLTSGRW